MLMILSPSLELKVSRVALFEVKFLKTIKKSLFIFFEAKEEQNQRHWKFYFSFYLVHDPERQAIFLSILGRIFLNVRIFQENHNLE